MVYKLFGGTEGCWIQICCTPSSKMVNKASKWRNPRWPPPTSWNVHCVPKNIPNVLDCNLKTNYQILIIFGKNIPDTTCHQITIQFPTSPNVCFCTTWGKQLCTITQCSYSTGPDVFTSHLLFCLLKLIFIAQSRRFGDTISKYNKVQISSALGDFMLLWQQKNP